MNRNGKCPCCNKQVEDILSLIQLDKLDNRISKSNSNPDVDFFLKSTSSHDLAFPNLGGAGSLNIAEGSYGTIKRFLNVVSKYACGTHSTKYLYYSGGYDDNGKLLLDTKHLKKYIAYFIEIPEENNYKKKVSKEMFSVLKEVDIKPDITGITQIVVGVPLSIYKNKNKVEKQSRTFGESLK